MTYIGRYARGSLIRELLWDLIRNDAEFSQNPFTMKEFYSKYKGYLEEKVSTLKRGSSVEAMVKGGLQGLCKKGLLTSSKITGDTSYHVNIYMTYKALTIFSYGRALIEAQRLRLL
jgi:hypothetical protein